MIHCSSSAAGRLFVDLNGEVVRARDEVTLYVFGVASGLARRMRCGVADVLLFAGAVPGCCQ